MIEVRMPRVSRAFKANFGEVRACVRNWMNAIGRLYALLGSWGIGGLFVQFEHS